MIFREYERINIHCSFFYKHRLSSFFHKYVNLQLCFFKGLFCSFCFKLIFKSVFQRIAQFVASTQGLQTIVYLSRWQLTLSSVEMINIYYSFFYKHRLLLFLHLYINLQLYFLRTFSFFLFYSFLQEYFSNNYL